MEFALGCTTELPFSLTKILQKRSFERAGVRYVPTLAQFAHRNQALAVFSFNFTAWSA